MHRPATQPAQPPRLTRRQRAALLQSRPSRNLLADYESLLEDFPHHIHAARKLKITDPKHDAVIRMALRGFSLTSKVYKWDAAHFLYVRRRAAQHYESLGDAPLLFFALGAGYALGLAAELQLTKPEFRAAEAHLDDTIRLHLAAIRQGLAAGLALAQKSA